MFYAHEGFSSDNVFTTSRSFKAFNTKKERKQYQDKIWKESNRSKNLIFCKRKDVTEVHPNFYVAGNDIYPSYEEYSIAKEMKKYMQQ